MLRVLAEGYAIFSASFELRSCFRDTVTVLHAWKRASAQAEPCSLLFSVCIQKPVNIRSGYFQ